MRLFKLPELSVTSNIFWSVLIALLAGLLGVKYLYCLMVEDASPISIVWEWLLSALLAGVFLLGSARLGGAFRLLFQSTTIILALILFTTTLAGAIGVYVTGDIPRLQQLNGLTWGMVGHSVVPMLIALKSNIVIASLCGLALVLALFFIHRIKLVIPLITLLAVAATDQLWLYIQKCDNCGAPQALLLTEMVKADIDRSLAVSQFMEDQSREFFDDFNKKLHSEIGIKPEYASLVQNSAGKNIILLVMESVRAKDVPLYGGSAIMPTVESLRPNMVLLENLYSQDIRSTKAYPSLEMGSFGLISWDNYSFNLTRKYTEKSLASQLKKLGYHTSVYVNGDKNYDRHKEYHLYRGYDEVLYAQDINSNGYNDDQEMLRQIDRKIEEQDRPFYIVLWPIATHHPYTRSFWADKASWHENNPQGIRHDDSEGHKNYLLALNETDQFLADLIASLKRHNKLDDTIIIALGDHGEGFGEHNPGNVFHGNSLYEESVHVAGFIYSPMIAGNIRESTPIQTRDIPATVLHFASGGEKKYLHQGRSLLQHYQYELPIYLYNSWTKHKGIIYNGMKLRTRVKPGSPVYFSSIKDIRELPQSESYIETNPEVYGDTLAELNRWYKAMQTYSILELTNKLNGDAIDAYLRLYCDDGEGFREGLKRRIAVTGDDYLLMDFKLSCQRLRLAPISTSYDPKEELLQFYIEDFEISLSDGSTLTLPELSISRLHHAKALSDFNFIIRNTSTIDYELTEKPVMIDKVRMRVKYVFKPVAEANSG